MKPTSRFFIYVALGLGLCFSSISCLENASYSFAPGGEGAIHVPLESASIDDVRAHLFDCMSTSGSTYCVTICHRPPGNPDNAKTKILPLSASLAHLNHGGPHEDRDYLGECGDHSDDEGSSDDEESSDDEDSSDDPPAEDPPVDLPPWCLELQDRDSDCDGYDDETGEGLL